MSLGQLTADYADDSDIEDEQPLEHSQQQTDKLGKHSGGTRRRSGSSPKTSAVSRGKVSSSSKDENRTKKKRLSREDIQRSPPPPEKNIDDKLSPMSSPIDATTRLTGVIIDDDDDVSPPPRPSPSNPRLGELRGDSNRGSPHGSGSEKNTPVKKLNRLVSYYNEEDDEADDSSDSEDAADEVLHSEPMDTGTDDDTSQPLSSGASHPSSPHTTPGGGAVINGIKLPAPPQGKKCSQHLQDKIGKLLSDLNRSNTDHNHKIQNTKAFRNPSIYEKLVDHLQIDENGTNYPVALYDPHCWGKESYYEELARLQKEDNDRREKERKEKTKVDFVSGTKKIGGDEEVKKRKSRFDTGRPDGAAGSVAKPVGLVSAIPTGPKTTIDAFGSLAKKTKA